MASDLHLLEAVSPTAALNGLSATAGDPQVLFAPGPEPLPVASAFGEQLRDASAVSLLTDLTSVLQAPNGGAVTRVREKEVSPTDGNGLSLPVIPIPKPTQFALPLNFALPANRAVEQPVPGASPENLQSQIESQPGGPDNSPLLTGTSTKPVTQAVPQAPGVTHAAVSLPAQIVPPAAIVPLPASPDTSQATPAATVPLRATVSTTTLSVVTKPGATVAQSKSVKEPVQAAQLDAPVLTPTATKQTQAPAALDPVSPPAGPVPGLTLTSQQSPTPEQEDSSQLPLPAASSTPTPIVAAPETPVSVAGAVQQKAPIRPFGVVVSSHETVAPKSYRQQLSQPPANWAPAAILRSRPIEPSSGPAPSSPIQQETKPAAEFSQSKAPPASAGMVDQQQPQTQPDVISKMAFAPVAQPVSGELAFAVRVTPQENAPPAAESGDAVKPLVTSSTAPVVPVKESRRAENDGTLADGGAPQHDTAHETPLPTAALPLAEKQAAPSVSVPEVHTATPLHNNPVEVAQLKETPEAKPLQPVKQLSIQVGQEQQRVELRVVERAGELQVAVRASNPDMAQGLRQGLSDLVGQLGQNGFHADAWRPGATAGMPPAAAEKPQTQPGSPNNNSQSQSGSEQDRQQGNHNPSRRPQWVEELEATSAGSGDRFAGETYGISR